MSPPRSWPPWPRVDWSGPMSAERKLHFVAIGGAGMSALALVCARRGIAVSGSDRSASAYLERLRAAGIDARVGHDAANVPGDAEVVVSTAIPDDNPELMIARERDQRVVHRGELLAELAAEGRLIAVAGAHGKTTTTGMIVHAMRALGADPTFFIGGELPGAGPGGAPANAAAGDGEWIVAEADESDGSFLKLRPEVAVVTNIELDHHAHWGSLAQLHDAFAAFCRPARAVVAGPGAGLGIEPAELTEFGAGAPGPGELALAVPGAHNVLNARAAIGALEAAGFDPVEVARALASFPGMVRRQQLKGERAGARIYDDYAHHPTEVRATIAALRELEPKRLVAVFQPHLYSRTLAFAEQFGAALAAADVIGVCEIYPAREEPVGRLAGVSGIQVARAAADHAAGRRVLWLGGLDDAALLLPGLIRPGDLLVTIGAGDVVTLGERLVAEAER